MKIPSSLACIALLAAAVMLADIPVDLFAQTDEFDELRRDNIPPAALLTDRGSELVKRLRQLRRTEARMGSRHPALPEVRQQIAEVKEQLRAWQPAPNPFRAAEPSAESSAIGKPVPLMNEEDLRQVVLALTQEVRHLRQRVEALEQAVGEAE